MERSKLLKLFLPPLCSTNQEIASISPELSPNFYGILSRFIISMLSLSNEDKNWCFMSVILVYLVILLYPRAYNTLSCCSHHCNIYSIVLEDYITWLLLFHILNIRVTTLLSCTWSSSLFSMKATNPI